MKTNIVKYISILLLLLCQSHSYSQALIVDVIDLNDGAIVHDMAYDEFNDVYILVGDFTHVNGQAVPGVAFINGADYSLLNDPSLEDGAFHFIESFNGPVYSVEFTHKYNGGFFPNHNYNYHFGGDFTHVNGDAFADERNGCVRFEYSNSGDYAPIPDDEPPTISDWNPAIEEVAYAHPIIRDMDVIGDTIILGGDFYHPGSGSHYLVGYRMFTGMFVEDELTDYPATTFGGALYNGVTHVQFMHDVLYVSTYPEDLGGSGDLRRILPEGGVDPAFWAEQPADNGFYRFFELETDLIIGLVSDIADGGGTRGENIYVYDALTGDHVPEHSFDTPGYPNEHSAIGFYKDYLFSGAYHNTHGFFSYQKALYGEDIDGISWNADVNSYLNFTGKDHLFIHQNILFTSASNLTDVDGSLRNGLALFCLEPADINLFTIYDTTICQRDTLTYAVEQAQYADGYIWEYTGSGIDIGNTGAPENLSDTLFLIDGSPWSREIRFTPAFTPGELRVTPFSNCDGHIAAEVLLKANTISINIDTNPLPHAFAGDDTTLTCDRTELVLHGHSDTADVTYEWIVLDGDDILIHPFQDTTIDDPATYVLTVINTMGCLNYDTVLVEMDTLKPTFDPILGPFDLTCDDTVRTYLGVCNNLTDTTTYWRQLSTGAIFDNPIDVSLPGQYRFYTLNNQNGCSDSLTILVYLNQPSPNIEIIGYADIPVEVPLDTLNCYDPTLLLECYSDTASTVLNWVEADSTDPIGPIIDITEGGNYYILAQNTENGCFNFVGLNIAEDFAKPNVILPEITALNCSNDSLILNGSTIFTDTLMQWTGDGIPPSPNPVTVFDPGNYYLTVTKNDNGCSQVDTIEVISDNSIDVFAGNDTVGCTEDFIFLTAGYIGTITGISYLWDNGTTDPTAMYTAGTDPYAIVEVFGDDACYGSDTIYIDIPPYPIIAFEGFQPCGEGATGSIITTPISGWAPFEYSLDGGVTFQTSPALTGLDFGTYNILVKDSLDCLYEFSATIDETSDLPNPQFTFSTYNFQLDTVIVIDISNPPTDSVNWIFSSELDYVGELDGSPLIALPETGSFTITMDAYYGDCLVSLTKEIIVSEFDSTFANFNNQNGIKSVDLYPNPTSGLFTAKIEFYKKQRVAMAVQDMLGYVYDERTFADTDVLEETFELGLEAVNGTYVLHIISEFDSAYITFILSR